MRDVSSSFLMVHGSQQGWAVLVVYSGAWCIFVKNVGCLCDFIDVLGAWCMVHGAWCMVVNTAGLSF